MVELEEAWVRIPDSKGRKDLIVVFIKGSGIL